MSNLANFVRRDDGVASVFSLFWLVIVLLIVGVAIDSGNMWLRYQQLKQTADVAAHAGIVALAAGGDEAETRAAAALFVEKNMPVAKYGNLYENAALDIEVLEYDPDAGTWMAPASISAANSVRVTLHRNELSGNPVDMLVLQIASVVAGGASDNLAEWNFKAIGSAALGGVDHCNSWNALMSPADVDLTSQSTFHTGMCLHSQSRVWMPQNNTFDPGAFVGMPDLAQCGNKCVDAANPGATDAALQQNLILADIGDQITATETAFLSNPGQNDRKDAFFSDKPITDLQPLIDLGIDVSGVNTAGDVLPIDFDDFEELATDEIPQGITYDVDCSHSSDTLQIGGKLTGGGPPRDMVVPTNLAIITNCPLKFEGDTNSIDSTLIVTSGDVSAGSSATFGGDAGAAQCSPDKHATIMAAGDVHVPAKFAGSNMSIITDGSFHMSGAAHSMGHYGLNISASDGIKVTAGHEFTACPQPDDDFTEAPRVIRMLAPVAP